MKTKQTVAIIGAAGARGAALSKLLSHGNYRLLLLDIHEGRLQALCSSISDQNAAAEVEAHSCTKDACWEADIILLTIPYESLAAVAERIEQVSNQKVLICAINAPLQNNPNAEHKGVALQLQLRLPNAHVTAAFHGFHADACNLSESNRPDIFVAGDDDDAIQTTVDLVRSTGFRPLIAGKLNVSIAMESVANLLKAISLYNPQIQVKGFKIL